MAVRKLSPGKIVILLLALVFFLGIGTVALVGKRLTPSPYTCHTQTLQSLNHFAGAHFTVSHTACQDYTHKQFISVYVQRSVGPHAPFYAHWFNKPTLLFRYHPESATAPPPALTQVAAHTVQISVPSVSKVDYKRPQWLQLTIRYSIGHVGHPPVDGGQATAPRAPTAAPQTKPPKVH